MTGNRRNHRSAQAEQYRRWYKSGHWQVRRTDQLAREPLCRLCKSRGRITAATVADHIEPHRGDPQKFWYGDLQSLCTDCHNADKQREEHRGYRGNVDASGYPVDPRHPWNAR